MDTIMHKALSDAAYTACAACTFRRADFAARLWHHQVSAQEYERQGLPKFRPLRHLLPDQSPDHPPDSTYPADLWRSSLVGPAAHPHLHPIRP